jgi:large subunit ribosomal protein LP0
MPINERKSEYFVRLERMFEKYTKVFVVGVDHVGSNQMQKIRVALRGKAEVVMGKNTMMRKALRGYIPKNSKVETIMPYVQGNMGFVFTNGNLREIRDIINAGRVPAAARAGVISPVDVEIPAILTGLDPAQTSFFQALNIPTKINKGQIEISKPVQILIKGQKVGSSEATLLAKLNIFPFKYGFEILKVYENGSMFDLSVLDITDENILSKFLIGLQNVASISLQTGFPTQASVVHSVVNAYKNVQAIAVATSYTYPQIAKLKEILENPAAFAAAAAPAASAAPAAAAAAPAAAAKAPAKEKSESDADMGLGLFD